MNINQEKYRIGRQLKGTNITESKGYIMTEILHQEYTAILYLYACNT